VRNLDLASFPTRRSSELASIGVSDELTFEIPSIEARETRREGAIPLPSQTVASETGVGGAGGRPAQGDKFARGNEPLHRCRVVRSEEHTSELQSRENLVC